jgi:RHS repeat-associated protein
MTAMPHLQDLGWNFKEEIVRTVRHRRTDGGTPETTYYQYDGQGQRIRKTTENTANPSDVPTRKDERIYVAGYELYKEYTGTDAGLERRSLSLLEKQHRFVMIETRNDVDDGTERHLVRYQLPNHLGSASLELDGSDDANVIWYEEYHPFGTTAYQARNATIRSAAKRYRYTGMERDEETGLEYHAARYYMPWLGRWASADPIGVRDGSNVYQYANNHVTRYSDPTGLQAETEPAHKDAVENTPDWLQRKNLADWKISEEHSANKHYWDPTHGPKGWVMYGIPKTFRADTMVTMPSLTPVLVTTTAPAIGPVPLVSPVTIIKPFVKTIDVGSKVPFLLYNTTDAKWWTPTSGDGWDTKDDLTATGSFLAGNEYTQQLDAVIKTIKARSTVTVLSIYIVIGGKGHSGETFSNQAVMEAAARGAFEQTKKYLQRYGLGNIMITGKGEFKPNQSQTTIVIQQKPASGSKGTKGE